MVSREVALDYGKCLPARICGLYRRPEMLLGVSERIVDCLLDQVVLR